MFIVFTVNGDVSLIRGVGDDACMCDMMSMNELSDG